MPAKLDEIIATVNDPVLRARLEFEAKDVDRSIGALEENNKKLLSENVNIKKRYNVPAVVSISREEARDYRKYQEAKARAEKAGTQLKITDDGPNAATELPPKYLRHDGKFYVSSSWIKENGGGFRVNKEAQGAEVVYATPQNITHLPQEVQEAFKE